MANDAFSSMINMMMYNVTNGDLKKLLKSVKPERLWLSSPRSASRRACSLPLSTASFSKRRTVTLAVFRNFGLPRINHVNPGRLRKLNWISQVYQYINVYHIRMVEAIASTEF